MRQENGGIVMQMRVAVIKGDGIGPEVVSQAMRVLKTIGEKYDHEFAFTEVLAGGAAIDHYGVSTPKDTIVVCKESDAVLLGALGGPKWDNFDADSKPEMSLLTIRKELGLFANIRPAILFEELIGASPLKSSIAEGGFEFIIFRELTGGIYFGSKESSTNFAYDRSEYQDWEIERIAKKAFEEAMKRKKEVISVDKANVLETSRLWRRTVSKVALQYPEVSLEHMYVDNAAMQLLRNPKQFDVLLTENMFGDILSDEASMLCGSIGMLPSASIGDGNFGLYEPAHGTAPDIAGQNIANPIATILSAAMMLRHTFGLNAEAEKIEEAIKKALAKGYRTQDIARNDIILGTKEITDKIIEFI
jgi:3-isopropylmalate dehydrogenase